MLIGPYFAWVNEEAGIVVAIATGFFTTYVLIALIDVQRNLEDPFVAGHLLDGQAMNEIFDFTLRALLELKQKADKRLPSRVDTKQAEEADSLELPPS